MQTKKMKTALLKKHSFAQLLICMMVHGRLLQ